MARFQPSVYSAADTAVGATPSAPSVPQSKTLTEQVLSWSSWLAMPVAFALSYDRNQSFLWAVPTAIFIPRVYLAVRGTQYALQKVK